MGNTITKDTVILKHVTHGDETWEYDVEENATLLLVFRVDTSTSVTLVPTVRLIGKNARATVLGMITGAGVSRIHIKTLQHHIAPQTTSDLLIKSVLSGASSSVYEGSISVDPKAQKTDAYQRNENLLMSAGARAVSSPALEILANDVRCTHGAVVKTIDSGELWYLRSRGIDLDRARGMIAEGFLLSTIDRIPDGTMRDEGTARFGKEE